MQTHSLKKFWFLCLGLCGLIFFALLFSLQTGHLSLSYSDMWQVLTGSGTDAQRLLLVQFRLPRIMIALLVGMAMGVAGAIFQGITQNGLADPGILGINTGAGFAVVLFLAMTSGNMEQVGSLEVVNLPFVAFVGGVSAAALIYLLAWKKGVTPIRMVLVGIGVNAGFGAALMLVQLQTDESTFNRATIWLSGSIWNAHWDTVWSILPWIVVLLPLAIYHSRALNILHLGDEVAVGLGTSVEWERVKWIGIAVALASASVSAAGSISFLGLGAPHLAKKVIGGNYRFSLPVSALIGALLMVVSDMVARTLFAPSEIPVGLVVSVIGAPYFMYLLMSIEE